METFRFCSLNCNLVTEHEALILSVFQGMRMSRPDVVRATLELVVEEIAVADLVPVILSLGRSLTEAGLYSNAANGMPSEKR